MKIKIDFLLQGFGFENIHDFKMSAFGFMLSDKVMAVSFSIGVIKSFFNDFLGLPFMVFIAFVLLNVLEYCSGIKVAKKQKKRIESRKMGRMFLKVGVYMIILFILQSFKQGYNFPEIQGYELNPFIVMYWSFLTGIIYQLFRSLLENLEALGYKEAKGILGDLTRRFSNNEVDE